MLDFAVSMLVETTRSLAIDIESVQSVMTARMFLLKVILKPDPGNPQELYLKSLKALGIDTQQHDVRFVEDNWENPALGAWGLGWEVWLDGETQPQSGRFI